MRYWLMKSEPSDVSVDDVAAMPKQTVPWYGVRGYQARNYMAKEMSVGDGVLFYHSSCPEPGIVGIAEVATEAYPDATQFDPKSKYFDEKSSPESPRWKNVDVHLLRKTRLFGLDEMRADTALADMIVLRRGNRLSITPVSAAEWRHVTKLLA
ncbi:MAG: EVE domain-containing protein [Pseudomonadota bacterium]|nr:EVE domain-containing protein [Pseudomonadota bacterium]